MSSDHYEEMQRREKPGTEQDYPKGFQTSLEAPAPLGPT